VSGVDRGSTTDPSKPLIIVVGMSREARIASGAGATVLVGGGQSDRLIEQLEFALELGASGVMSFGLCGGLDPALKAGDCVIGSGVIGDEGRVASDADWADRMARALPGVLRAEITGGSAMIALPADKIALRDRTGAAAVDMESHIVARLARRYDMPFAVLRSVSDPAHRALPIAAQAGFKANGKADIGAVLKALLRRPGELPALIRTALDAAAAFAALRDARHLLGPGLGRPNVVEHLVDVT
jgi:adenosylhomocysteine nucleosidase